MECERCLLLGRKRVAYFEDENGDPICIPCFLWEPLTLAEQKRWELYNAAHARVASAKARGEIVKQPCEICGTTVGIDAHHEDYTKPLEVRWLCQEHHRLVTYKRFFLLPVRSSGTEPCTSTFT